MSSRCAWSFLPERRRLDLTSNVIGGTIPSSLGVLLALTFFSLQSNAFVGTIPTTFTALTKLT